MVIDRAIPCHHLLEAQTIDVFEHEEVHVAVAVEIVRFDEVRVLELPRRLGFADEPFAGELILCPVRRQHLEGHLLPHYAMLGQKDLAHPAQADAIQ